MPVVRISPEIMRRSSRQAHKVVRVPAEISSKLEYERLGVEMARKMEFQKYCHDADFQHEIELIRIRRRSLARLYGSRW